MVDSDSRVKKYARLVTNKKDLAKRVKKAESVTTRHARRFIIKRLDNVRYVRRQIIGWLVLVGLVIAGVGVQLDWLHHDYIVMAAARGGTYAEASLGAADTLNPLYASTASEVAASHLLFSSLYQYDNTGHLHVDLADDLKIDDSRRTYTISLRSDARWHDGIPLTTKDVVYTVNLIKNFEARSPLASSWQDVQVKALDERRVEFILPATYASFPHALTFAILPSHILSGVAPSAVRENVFGRSPVGSGPFSFSKVQTASDGHHTIVQLVANKSYYKGAPKLDRFELHAYSKSADLTQAMKSGEVSAAADIAPSDAGKFDAEHYTTVTYPINSGVYALFNVARPAVKDKEVRKALQLATDAAALRRTLGSGVVKLDLPIMPSMLTSSGLPRVPSPDVIAAGALLDQSGWHLNGAVREKDGQKLELNLVTAKDDQYDTAASELARQWRAIGVKVSITTVDRSSPGTNFTQNVLQQRNYDVLLYKLAIGGDPDVYAYWHSSQTSAGGYNFSNYSSPTADAALSSARSRVEPDLRNAKYLTFVNAWIEDAPAIGLYQPVVKYVSTKNARSVERGSVFVNAADRYSNVIDWTVNLGSKYETP